MKRRLHLGRLSLVILLTAGCTPQTNSNSTTTGAASSPVSNPLDTTTATHSPTSAIAGTNVAQNQQKVLAVGNLVKGEHPTSGRVQLLQQGKERILELGSDFKTSNLGPDLVVILHRSPDVIGSTVPPAYPIQEGDYVLLAPLKRFTGAQRYPVPAEINLAEYPSAAIWCRRFNATFGAAQLGKR
jgi:hypothetical protein